MSSLSKSNAKEHCRTCLTKIKIDENELNCSDSKDICIRIYNNGALQTFLDKYIDDERIKQNAEQYPQHVCLSCFNSIQEADRFLTQARLSAGTLLNLIYDPAENSGLNNEIFKVSTKDSLMEPETVLIESHAHQEIEDTIHPDPFSSSSLNENNKNHDEWDTCSEDDVSGAEIEYIISTNEVTSPIKAEKQYAIKTFRKKNIKDTKKRKRRTKQELEQQLNEIIEKTTKEDNKSKLQQAGIKDDYKCEQCTQCFEYKFTLDAHVRKIHDGSTQPFHCHLCDKTFNFIMGLYTHIKEMHANEKPTHICDFQKCGRTYTSLSALQMHKRLKHTAEGEQKKFVCEQCGAAFNQSYNLLYHRRCKHSTEAEKADLQFYECEICQKKFHTSYTLKYHKMQLHSTEMNFECEICGIKKATKFMLATHMRIHSKDKMPCEHCGRQFTRKSEMEAHIRTVHMKLKPFACKYCSESFARRKTLRYHEFIHTGEKPFVCQTCGQSYRQPTCLKNHMKLHEKL